MKKTKMKKILIHCILIAGIGVAILPFFWMITTAFKTQGESVQMPPVWFPATWNLDAFMEIIKFPANGIAVTMQKFARRIYVFCL